MNFADVGLSSVWINALYTPYLFFCTFLFQTFDQIDNGIRNPRDNQ